jgi:hypothetical protein
MVGTATAAAHGNAPNKFHVYDCGFKNDTTIQRIIPYKGLKKQKGRLATKNAIRTMTRTGIYDTPLRAALLLSTVIVPVSLSPCFSDTHMIEFRRDGSGLMDVT